MFSENLNEARHGIWDLLTLHARKRMDQRGITLEAVELALRVGRKIYARGAKYYVIGKKEIKRYGRYYPGLKRLDGLQLVCSPERGTIITLYRNPNLRAIKPSCRDKRSPLLLTEDFCSATGVSHD